MKKVQISMKPGSGEKQLCIRQQSLTDFSISEKESSHYGTSHDSQVLLCSFQSRQKRNCPAESTRTCTMR